LVGVLSCEGTVISLDAFCVTPHVIHDGANASVEEVPRTHACDDAFTLTAEMTSSIYAAYSHLFSAHQ
jgi:hypothetical protein